MNPSRPPKYGSEKSGALTNLYITLSPNRSRSTTPSFKMSKSSFRPTTGKCSRHAKSAARPRGRRRHLHPQSSDTPEEVCAATPQARRPFGEKKINLFIIDAFAVAKRNAQLIAGTRHAHAEHRLHRAGQPHGQEEAMARTSATRVGKDRKEIRLQGRCRGRSAT